MKTFAHRAALGLLAALAGFALTGCTSAPTRTVQRIEPARDFEVVETSARRPLTAKEMAELRASVARYLDQQQATEGGDYYLKVYLTPDQPDVTPEWVVVRFTRYTDTRVAVASSYPSAAYSYDSSYYSYDAYPYGYDGFSRISFQYYDDPYYGRRYYYPRRDHRNHDRDHDGHHDRKPDDRHDGQANNGDHGRPRHNPPDRPTPVQPVVSRPGWNHGPTGTPRPTTGTPSNPPRENPRAWRGREEANARPPSVTPAPRTEAPRAPAPAYKPQPEQRSSPPASSDRPENHGNGRKPETR